MCRRVVRGDMMIVVVIVVVVVASVGDLWMVDEGMLGRMFVFLICGM